MTNGFDTSIILPELMGRIGWAQPTQSDSVALSDVNKSSASGRTFQQFHPLLTLQNLLACQEDPNLSSDQFNEFLQNMLTGVCMSTVNAVFNRPQLLESTTIFERLRRNDNLTTNSGKFVGYRLWLAPGNYAALISKVSFLFSANATFNLYLFHDALKAPLQTQSITVQAYSEVTKDINWVLQRINSTHMSGVFYLGYFQNDLPAGCVAIEEFVTQWNDTYNLGYSAFEIPQVPGQVDFVRIAVPYTFKTYGMNAYLQVYRDFTDTILRNSHLFDELIGLSMAVMGLGIMTYSTRSNFTERITKEMAMQVYNEINNSENSQMSPYVAGLKKQITREISRVQDAFFHDPSKSNEIVTSRPQEWQSTSNPMLRV